MRLPSWHLQSDDERVLAGEENVHVGNYSPVRNDQEAEDEEGGVLQNDVDQDAPDVEVAANLFGLLQCFWLFVILRYNV